MKYLPLPQSALRDAQRELAERRAHTPLKPQAEQRVCDIGLFSDDAAQLDLIDLTRRDGRGTTRGA